MESAVIIEEIRRRQNKKYRGEEIIVRARIDPDRIPENIRQYPLAAATNAVRDLFEILIEQTSRNLRSSDLVRFCIQADGLDRPISTSIMKLSELTVEKILSVVMKVLQSKNEIRLDVGFTVDIITIQRDVGGGKGNRKVTNISIDRLRKKSVLSIPVDNQGLCCAKAILFALAHLKKDRKGINAMRDRRRPALLKRAKQLHVNAGVPHGPCTYAEIQKFESYLDVQIVVISAENLNKVSYLIFSSKNNIIFI